MKLLSPTGLLVVCMVAFLSFLGGVFANSPGTGMDFPENGTYKVVSVRKMFDEQTGRPIYWMVASPMKNGVSVERYQVYRIPRNMIVNVPADAKPDAGPVMKLELASGTGVLAQE